MLDRGGEAQDLQNLAQGSARRDCIFASPDRALLTGQPGGGAKAQWIRDYAGPMQCIPSRGGAGRRYHGIAGSGERAWRVVGFVDRHVAKVEAEDQREKAKDEAGAKFHARFSGMNGTVKPAMTENLGRARTKAPDPVSKSFFASFCSQKEDLN